MTHDEGMKLLAGYATNSLSDEERKALLAAALDDQELFDALEREQLLRDVFDDREARTEIRQALEMPAASSSHWWRRPWAWGLASAAIAAIALVAVWVGNNHQPSTVEVAQVTTTAELPPASAVSAPRPTEVKPAAPARARVRELPKTNPEPAAAAPIVSTDSVGTELLKQDQKAQVQQPAGAQAQMQTDQTRSMLAASKSVAPPTLNFTLLRRGANQRDEPVSPTDVQESDSIRLRVQPLFDGQLRVVLVRNGLVSMLQELQMVTALQNYIVPDKPVNVKAGDAIRVSLTGAGFPSSVTIPLGKP